MSSIVKLIGTIVVVVGVGILIGWLATRGPGGAPSAPDPLANNPTSSDSDRIPQPTAPPSSNSGGMRTQPALNPQPLGPTPPVPAPAYASGNVITNWEDRIDEILGGEGPEQTKAFQMLSLFPSLPEDGQVEVAQHLSNLLDDPNYGALAQYLTNATVSEPVLEVLIADVLNRPNAIKLPLLLEVARTDQHPKAGEAREILELFLEENYGRDWDTWHRKMKQWLQENPD